MPEPVTVPCQECRVELAADSPDLRLELTCDDEPLVYCAECWEWEFGEDARCEVSGRLVAEPHACEREGLVSSPLARFAVLRVYLVGNVEMGLPFVGAEPGT